MRNAQKNELDSVFPAVGVIFCKHPPPSPPYNLFDARTDMKQTKNIDTNCCVLIIQLGAIYNSNR